ncbi:hypothetical protein F5877DRAFT_72981 [Lentinula edodes]|nr:hypothetical protein F5877DRAFT_72981 [Lentinula edodes]
MQYLGDISLTDSLEIPQRFSSIRSFVYSNMAHVWCSDLPQLITSLPHLDSLAIFTNLGRDIMICHNSSTRWGLVEALEPFLKANSDTLKNLSIGLDYNLNLHHELNDHRNLPNLRSLTLQTHDIDALRQSTFSFLTRHQSVLGVLTLDLVPFIPVEGSYDEDHFRAILGECLNVDLSNKVKSLRVNILCPVIPSNRGYLDLAQRLSVGLLLKWEHIGKLEVRIIRGKKWQVDSVEYINRRIWGSVNLPYTEKLTRICSTHTHINLWRISLTFTKDVHKMEPRGIWICIDCEENDDKRLQEEQKVPASKFITAQMLHTGCRESEEGKKAGKVKKEKEELEAESESLSQALFEEANNMVATERKLRAETESKLQRQQQDLKEELREAQAKGSPSGARYRWSRARWMCC